MLKRPRPLLALVIAFVFSIGALAQDAVVKIEATDNFSDALQEALILAEPGTVIELPEGVFTFSDPLSLDIANVTLRGAGKDKTTLSFKKQQAGSEGLLITSDNVTIEHLAIEDTPGDGIKAKGVDTVTFRDVRIEWTGGPKESNGAYGLYPVSSKNVLIENAVVRGASDAGIYVGQSENIIVRNSIAEYNVAGIEIENSYFADVYNNHVEHNTGGILVFDLPNLLKKGGHSVRVYNNKSINNDTPNFAPPGNIVGTVPMGTGIMVMANRDVEVFGNELSGNGSVHVLIASYPRDYNDDDYNPLPQNIFIHNNTYGDGGYAPDKAVAELVAPRTGTPVPDIVWDGVVGGIWAAFFGAADDAGIYIDEAEDTRFANLRLMLDFILPWGADSDTNIAAYRGSISERVAVKLPQDQSASD